MTITAQITFLHFQSTNNLTQQFDDFMKDTALDDIRNSVNFEARNFDEAEADEDFEEPVMVDEGWFLLTYIHQAYMNSFYE